jgi:hypothetical protein
MQCSKPSPEEQAMLAAKGYYDHLLLGEYDHFLEGRADVDSTFPPDYREELVVALKQFMVQQQTQHRGVNAVRAVRASLDSLSLSSANVFLVLCFGDSTNEEIVVPMIERDGRWLMK